MENRLIDLMKLFTQTHERLRAASPAMREVQTVRTLYPGLLLPPEEHDLYACRMLCRFGQELPLDCSPKLHNQVGYTMLIERFDKLKAACPERAGEIEEIVDYWKRESTFVKLRNEAPKDIRDYLFRPGTGLDEYGYMRCSQGKRPLGAGFVSGSYDTRTAGIMPDFAKAVRLGLNGLRAEVKEAARQKPGSADFYEACLYALDTVEICLADYAEKCRACGRMDMARICEELRHEPPKSYRAALQWVLLLAMLMRVDNFGRLDMALGDILLEEYRRKTLDFEQVVSQTIAFYDILAEYNMVYDSRIIVGGYGRANEEAADAFALAAIEAVRRCHRVVPVLTLRLANGQSPELFERALDAIADGCIYPTLYNDDAYIPGLMKSMNLSWDEAADYVPLGCGEIVLDHKSISSPNTTTRFLKALEAALHNGRDGADGAIIGCESGSLAELDSYERLENAFMAQVRYAAEHEIRLHVWNRERTGRECAMVLHSLLSDDCIARGCSIYEGGVRYFGANTEGFGLSNTANSLAAIKKLVFDEKRYTLSELVHILDKNFEGYDAARRDMLAVEKYGNGSDYVDRLKRHLEERINALYHEVGAASPLHYFTVANVNPGGITIGPYVAASADGRLCGTPMAVGNSPVPGSDRSGPTAMLLSCAQTDAENGGVVTNMNLSRATIAEHREAVKSLFEAYFQQGGLQLNINCFEKGDLERALVHPEQYGHLIVRVSGYSARFVELDPVTQRHIMERTLF